MRRIVGRQFPTINEWTVAKAQKREKKKEKKANQLDKRTLPKGFREGRVEPPIEIEEVEHATQHTKIQPEKHEKPSSCLQNDEISKAGGIIYYNYINLKNN